MNPTRRVPGKGGAKRSRERTRKLAIKVAELQKRAAARMGTSQPKSPAEMVELLKRMRKFLKEAIHELKEEYDLE